MKKAGHPGLGRSINAKILANAVVRAKGNYAAAGRELGITRQTVGDRVQQTPAVQSEIFALLRRCKITPTKVIRKLYEGLSATNKQYFAMLGTVCDEREDPDYTTRHKNSVTLLQLMGYLKGANGNGHDPAIGGDVHFHHTQVFQDINLTELEQMPYAECLRQVTDRLSRQRSES